MTPPRRAWKPKARSSSVPEPVVVDPAAHGLPTPATLEAIALEAAIEGAEAIRVAGRQPHVLGTKSTPTDPVTALDLAVERMIRGRLERLTPAAGFLGEEEGTRAGASALGWVLDPIDGTVNLTYGIPAIAVSLAATISGRVVAGVVIDPWRGEAFSASLGTGARIDGVPIATSTVSRLSDALVATGFSYSSDGRVAQVEAIGRVLPAARDVRCFGSSALHLCWVANGRLDAYYQRGMQPWDYAAGSLIAEEAGARLVHPTPANGQLMVAASPQVLEPLLALLV
jgi:myo-inositol-1(or 4)-monophosphatase